MSLQPTPIVFPDAELWLTTALRAALGARAEIWASAAFVSNRVPSPRRDRMVIVRRDGGPTDGMFDLPRIGVNVWGTTEQEATDLARLVCALMSTLPGSSGCVSVTQQSGPIPIADESGQPRRYSVFQARLRGTPLEEF